MEPVLSAKQCQSFDQFAIEQGCVPGVVLMENAGRRAADILLERFATPAHVVVVVGPGNNGGDGYVLARHLLLRDVRVVVVSLVPTDGLFGDAKVNAVAWASCGGKTETVRTRAELDGFVGDATLLVDAMFGTGLSRRLDGLFAQAVVAMNGAQAPVLALDLPSGLDADSGKILGQAAIEAAVTVSFAFAKPGLFSANGYQACGALEIADIGVPQSLHARAGLQPVAERVTPSDVRAWLRLRPLPLHKGQAKRVAVLAGSPGKFGAGWLTARAALRGGAGVVTLDGVELGDASPLPEVMHAFLPDVGALPSRLEDRLQGAAAVALGPGLGFSDVSRACVDWVLRNYSGAAVLDADALTLLKGRLKTQRAANATLVLTPHPAEAARLLGVTTREIEEDRFTAVRALSDQTGAVVLLKGVHTLITAPDRTTVVNDTGAPSLATAGSGDVLTGALAAMLCFLPPFEAAIVAAWVHGRAGESWQALPHFAGGMLASEIADRLPAAMAAISDQTAG